MGLGTKRVRRNQDGVEVLGIGAEELEIRLLNLNNPDTEQWFKAEQSKSNKVEYLQYRKCKWSQSFLQKRKRKKKKPLPWILIIICQGYNGPVILHANNNFQSQWSSDIIQFIVKVCSLELTPTKAWLLKRSTAGRIPLCHRITSHRHQLQNRQWITNTS